MKAERIAVLGGGSWATALIKILTEKEVSVNWWMRNAEAVAHVRKFKHNLSYLTDVEIDITKVNASADLNQVLEGVDTCILAVPAAFLEQVLEQTSQVAFEGMSVYSAIKGIVPSRMMIIGDYLHNVYGVPLNNIGVLTGPCHAEEVALEKLSYLTVASQNLINAKKMADALACRYIRTNVSDDIYGTEYSAVLKNVMAIASGISHGLGYGDNFQAVLISNAIREIKDFVDVVHPINRDIKDSAYLGDLLVTAYSQFSRNRTFGSMIGKGYSVNSAQIEMNMVAEGYYAVKCIHEINKKFSIHMPICSAVYNILYDKASPKTEIRLLSERIN